MGRNKASRTTARAKAVGKWKKFVIEILIELKLGHAAKAKGAAYRAVPCRTPCPMFHSLQSLWLFVCLCRFFRYATKFFDKLIRLFACCSSSASSSSSLLLALLLSSHGPCRHPSRAQDAAGATANANVTHFNLLLIKFL